MPQSRTLTIGYAPDSDDAFCHYGLMSGRVSSPDFQCEFHADSLPQLNAAAREHRYDVTAISSVHYPTVAEFYRILSVGANVGRGYGPVLVSLNYFHPDQLHFRRVGIDAASTTSAFLLRWTCPDAQLVELPGEAIPAAIVAGDLDAGVMVHEQIVHFPRYGLRRLVDLGAQWSERTSLPLPLELNVISRRFDDETTLAIGELLRSSVRYGLDHESEALAWAGHYGLGEEAACTARHVALFASRDSLLLADDVREALGQLMIASHELGLNARGLVELDVVERRPAARPQQQIIQAA
jgi:1,4-dihydroxy-6-naphthoate synthase